MTTQGKFHITTKNGRQRTRWLELFGTDRLPVTNASPQEVFYKDGRSEWIYTLDTAALGDRGCRRLAAHIAAHRWGTTSESALAEVRRGWPVGADDCELVTAGRLATESAPNSSTETRSAITGPTVLGNGRTPRPRRNSREGWAYGRSASGDSWELPSC